ncbi:hypothetical protein BC940DRAFT_321803 [Gongronella butleri]|nr:hypothetical protein BC940DRAFT_321803 [Gongronella butleri]
MPALLDKIEAAKPDCLAPARVLEAFLEHLEPARASNFNPTRSMHSYNAYQQLVAMKEVDPVPSFKELLQKKKLEYREILLPIEECTPLCYRQRELEKLFKKMKKALNIYKNLGFNVLFVTVPCNKEDHSALAKNHTKSFVKHLERQFGDCYQTFCDEKSAFKAMSSKEITGTIGDSSSSSGVEVQAVTGMKSREQGRKLLVDLFGNDLVAVIDGLRVNGGVPSKTCIHDILFFQ